MHKNCVVGKIDCIFETEVIENNFCGKRKHQIYKIVASERLRKEFDNSIAAGSSQATIKVDGTSCRISEFQGKPWLWARHDVKPNKSADKRFKEYQSRKNISIWSGTKFDEKFLWDLSKDFKSLPDHWVSASGASKVNLQPSNNGHLVGWVPIDSTSRQHIWHLSVVDLNSGLFVCLKERSDGELVIVVDELKKFLGKTFELIGTKVNGNPYDIGSSEFPLHILIQHGELSLNSNMIYPLSKSKLKDWFTTAPDGLVEGIVWHANDGKMFKIHRHHLDLPWPVKDLPLSNRYVQIEFINFNGAESSNRLFQKLFSYNKNEAIKFSNLFKD